MRPSIVLTIGAAVSVACLMIAPADAAPIDRGVWLARVERARQECAAYVGGAIERRETLRSSSHPSAAVVASDFDDPTLRYGDVIVHAGRLLVFRGTPGERRSADDFRDLAGQQLGGVHDGELRAIDAVVRTRPPD